MAQPAATFHSNVSIEHNANLEQMAKKILGFFELSPEPKNSNDIALLLFKGAPFSRKSSATLFRLLRHMANKNQLTIEMRHVPEVNRKMPFYSLPVKVISRPGDVLEVTETEHGWQLKGVDRKGIRRTLGLYKHSTSPKQFEDRKAQFLRQLEA